MGQLGEMVPTVFGEIAGFDKPNHQTVPLQQPFIMTPKKGSKSISRRTSMVGEYRLQVTSVKEGGRASFLQVGL